MTFLPIAHRELRVSSRLPATRRWRILFAIGALAVAGAIGLIVRQSRGMFALQAGVWTFVALEWAAFVVACGAGVFLTSDCLSQEKREGTLGLLFLTDLRGYDVAFGKLLATSLRTFYSLLAVFPVMALSFMLGGVPADQFRHTLLALCNTLFFSLALGLLISALSRDANRAMTATIAALLVFLFLLPAMDEAFLKRFANLPRLGLLSPAYSILHAADYRTNYFWSSVAFVHALGWCFLAVASWLAPRTWQEKALRGTLRRMPLLAFSRTARQSELRDQNPIAWLIARDRWASNISRLALLLILGLFVVSVAYSWNRPIVPTLALPSTTSSTTTVTNSGSTSTYTTVVVRSRANVVNTTPFQIANWCATLLSLGLEFWLATHVSRFYIDGRKSGFLEILLTTPVTPSALVRGHWLGLRRLFLTPMAAQPALTLGMGAMGIMALSVSGGPSPGDFKTMQTVSLVLGLVNWSAGVFAIAWFSIWMALSSRTLNLAVLKTFSCVKALPWLLVTFFSGILFFAGGLMMGRSRLWLLGAIPQILMFILNIGLIWFARRAVRRAFPTFAERIKS